MKEKVEFMDRDFLDNKINIGDKVIFETPQYRDFTIGTVITNAPKSCQIEFINTSGLCKGYVSVIRQCYGQIIKYPITKEGKWTDVVDYGDSKVVKCTSCNYEFFFMKKGQLNIDKMRYCPNCGAKMEVE